MNPYLVLNVAPDASDEAIRQAYLAAIKEAPPEIDPARFKVLTRAYGKIKDQTLRYRWELFDTEAPGDSPMEAFVAYARVCPRPAPLPFEAMKEYLRACSKT
jgi:curved DNA-binding protein CbpA